MKLRACLLVAGIILLAACSNKKEIPNTDIEVARSFVKYLLEDNFKEAAELIYTDDANAAFLKQLQKKQIETRLTKDLDNYKNADVIIYECNNVNDSVSIVNYSNTYKPTEINKVKVIRLNDRWLIDLKYTFSGN